MKKYKNYLFDLDGTLIDTIELIYQCFTFSLKKFGNIDADRDKVISHIGMPLADQFRVYFGPQSDELIKKAMAAHLQYQAEIYKDYLRLFPDVAEVLHALHAQGHSLAIVSSRRRESSIAYLEELGIRSFFLAIIGPEDSTRHKPDAEPAFKALEKLGGTSTESLFIGDSSFDIECGAAAGMDTAFVDWSHCKVSSLAVTPTYSIKSMNNLIVDIG